MKHKLSINKYSAKKLVQTFFVRVRRMGPIQTVLTFTELGAGETRVVALAILFLTLGFPTIAMFSIGSIHRTEGETVFVFGYFLCLFHTLRISITVRAVAAIALVCAHFARRETFTVHLQASSLLAVASSTFLS